MAAISKDILKKYNDLKKVCPDELLIVGLKGDYFAFEKDAKVIASQEFFTLVTVCDCKVDPFDVVTIKKNCFEKTIISLQKKGFKIKIVEHFIKGVDPGI